MSAVHPVRQYSWHHLFRRRAMWYTWYRTFLEVLIVFLRFDHGLSHGKPWPRILYGVSWTTTYKTPAKKQGRIFQHQSRTAWRWTGPRAQYRTFKAEPPYIKPFDSKEIKPRRTAPHRIIIRSKVRKSTKSSGTFYTVKSISKFNLQDIIRTTNKATGRTKWRSPVKKNP